MAERPARTDADKIQPSGVIAKTGGLTRFIVVVPVVGLLVSAIALVVIGAIDTVRIVIRALSPEVSTKKSLVAFIELADLFLLAVVIYIIALGLFELFIDRNLALPDWLRFNDLDDLKYRLIGVIIVVLAVLFLGRAIQSTNAMELFWLGAGTSLVIGSLAFYMKGHH